MRVGLLALLLIIGYQSFAQVSLTNGLVAYYPFNGTFNDASGNGNNGTPMNGVSFGTDQSGNPNSAALFDGVDDWINIGVPSFTFGHYFSIAFKFKPYSTIHQTLISRSDYLTAPHDAQFQIAFNHPTYTPKGLYLATNHNGNCLMPASGAFTHYAITSPTIQSNQWYCVVMTFNNGVKSIYMNGTLVLQTTVTVGANPTTVDSCSNGIFRLGSWWAGDPRYFNGIMDEVRIYNRSINQPEIDTLCNITMAPQPETILNQYAAVNSRLACSNTYSVDTATGFSVGDTILVIQMKGLSIDSTNSASFGNILSYNNAGNYEYNVVQAVSGNNITLRYQLQKAYTIPGGIVQFVKVPSYSSYTVSQKHSALPWTGSKGGVFALRVAGTLTLNAPIDVSGRGFTGGLANAIYSGTQICSVTGYYHSPNRDTSAQKGEGVAILSALRSYGRGKLANGGGGANAHNAGGGGGGNGGAGGIGGNQYLGCSGAPPGNVTGGIGGASLGYGATVGKIFLGGGGGAGHANDANSAPSNGGNGGGIVIINAGSIVGNGNSFFASGTDAPECPGAVTGCQNDGMGGGGGGGAMLITSGGITAGLFAQGGKGGNVYLSTPFLSLHHGPGGGGGGGSILVSTPIASILTSASVAGGASGVMPQNSNNAYGSLPGSTGQMGSGYSISLPTVVYTPNVMSVNFYDSIVACNIRKFVNTTTTSTTGIRSYSWSFGDGGSSTLQTPTYAYPNGGIYSVRLVVTDSLGCTDSATKSITVACTDTVINQYAAVLSQGVCNNIYTVDTATGFTTGDTILVIQMKGAVIDSSNSSSFGSVPAYNNAGFYEYNVVQSISGNNITLRYATLHNYNIPNGKLQFIKTPSFNNYNATRGLSCMPWTGSKGGVLAIRVAGTLTLNADVDVSGKGFRGGQPLYKNQQPCNKTDYFYSAANNEGGQKGEGITEVSAARLYGRGPQANGGGGGNGAKSGGGGGGHYAAGGAGGNQSITGACATTPNIGGVGGTALNSSPFSRAFLGGGGGSGQGNDIAEKAGGNGGGIIFINAATIAGNNHALRANGSNAPECSGAGVIGGGCANDGGGGGGAGGLIYSTASSITGNLSVQAAGGKGSNVYMIGDPQVGPGGGGGGGAWAFVSGSVGSGVVFTGTGGAAGVLPQFGSTSYGAQPGSNGQTYSSSAMPQANVLFNGNVINVAFSDSAISCFGRQMINKSVSISAVPITSNWYFPASATSNQLNPAYTFPGYGSYLVTLTIVDSNGCSSSLAKYVNIPYVHFAQGSGDTTVCNAKPVFLSATGGVSYVWTPAGSITSPTAAGTLANPAITTIYMVTVTDSKGCIDSDFVTVNISAGKSIEAFPADTIACSGSKVQLLATGGSFYQWTPIDGLNNPNIAAPIATLNGDMTYVVFATDTAGCKSTDTVTIHQRLNPEVRASAEGIGSKCEDKSVLLKATGNASSYSWSPASHVSNSNGNTTSAKPPVTTLYTVTGKDAFGCTGTDTVTAFVNDDAVVMMPDAFSPNGDSRNDMMHPMIFCDFTLDEYRIYDRWGKEVFVSNSVSNGWNGTRNGEPADVGIYHYIVIGRRPSNSQKIITKGNFILMR